MNRGSELVAFGFLVRNYFAEEAKRVGLTINPIVRDEKNTVLSEQIYEEVRGARQVVVALNEREGFDAFVKQTGLDFEVAMLKIFTDLDATVLPILWKTYVEWFYNHADESAILKILQIE